jgi:6,7-dimethyl-8-ribityllumazine synthase
LRIGIVVSRFNHEVTQRLTEGALEKLKQCGVEKIECFPVPGAFEIPGMAQHVGRSGRFDALVCLGAIIEGETPHFQYLCAEVFRGIGQVALNLGLPVTCGILTVTSQEHAVARSTGADNKGAEAAEAAVEIARRYPAAALSVGPT